MARTKIDKIKVEKWSTLYRSEPIRYSIFIYYDRLDHRGSILIPEEFEIFKKICKNPTLCILYMGKSTNFELSSIANDITKYCRNKKHIKWEWVNDIP